MKRSIAVGLGFVWVLSACDDPPPPPPPRDGGARDAGVDAFVEPCGSIDDGQVGGPCEDDADCGGMGAVCLDEDDGYRPGGFCTRPCLTDTECGPANQCASLVAVADVEPARDGGVAPPRLCMPRCCDEARCAPGFLCHDIFAGFFELGRVACIPGDPDSRDGDACTGAYECNASSICLAGVDAPGGVCVTIDCTPGDDSTCAPGGDAVCGEPPGFARTACADTCLLDADCRVAEGYRCHPTSRLCFHPRTGDACAVDADCGVSPRRCEPAPAFPGGYCSMPCASTEDDCGSDHLCHVPGGGAPPFCVRACEPDGDDCRAGYVCTPILGGNACLP